MGASVYTVGAMQDWEGYDQGIQELPFCILELSNVAKCYLQVIMDTNMAFNQWTSADVTNLFLYMLVVPIPTLKYHKCACTQQLHDIGL